MDDVHALVGAEDNECSKCVTISGVLVHECPDLLKGKTLIVILCIRSLAFDDEEIVGVISTPMDDEVGTDKVALRFRDFVLGAAQFADELGLAMALEVLGQCAVPVVLDVDLQVRATFFAQQQLEVEAESVAERNLVNTARHQVRILVGNELGGLVPEFSKPVCVHGTSVRIVRSLREEGRNALIDGGFVEGPEPGCGICRGVLREDVELYLRGARFERRSGSPNPLWKRVSPMRAHRSSVPVVVEAMVSHSGQLHRDSSSATKGPFLSRGRSMAQTSTLSGGMSLEPEPSCMRTEIVFLMEGIDKSAILPVAVRQAASRVANRYRGRTPLVARTGRSEAIEVLYMDPMFEAIFVADESTVRNALGHSSAPKDWPKFRTSSRELDKHVLAPAVDVADKKVLARVGGNYHTRKTAWGLRIVQQASQTAVLWTHKIIRRLCRLLHAAAVGGTLRA